MPNIIRLGDPTDHGGRVVASGAPHFTVGGIAVALKGDACSCPRRGHNGCTIAEGDHPRVVVDGPAGNVLRWLWGRAGDDAVASRFAGEFSHRRVTNVSSLSPDRNPFQRGFLGDYSSVAWSGNDALPTWSDGRNLDPAGRPDEDVFVAQIRQGEPH